MGMEDDGDVEGGAFNGWGRVGVGAGRCESGTWGRGEGVFI